MVEHQPSDEGLLKVVDSSSANGCREAIVVAQKKRFFDLVVTSFRQIATNADGTTSLIMTRFPGSTPGRSHQTYGAVA
ncbi:MAG: hypothetical protein ABI977_12225, partial [Acidobacteriota bacterium]